MIGGRGTGPEALSSIGALSHSVSLYHIGLLGLVGYQTAHKLSTRTKSSSSSNVRKGSDFSTQ